MTVLAKRQEWRRPKQLGPGRAPDLSDQELANVRAALRWLRVRAGSAAKLAEAMGAEPRAVGRVLGASRKPSLGLALRAARMAGVSLEDVLSGAWPADRCAHCGR